MTTIINKIKKTKFLKFVNLKTYKLVVIMFVFLFILASLSIYLEDDDLKLKVDDVLPLNEEWTFINPDNLTETISLPYRSDVPRNTIHSVSKILPEVFKYPTSIRIRSSMQHIVISLDDQIVFDNEIESIKGPFYEPVASAWYIIDIPADSDGSVMKMTVYSDVKMMSGRINEVYYGAHGDLIAELISRQPQTVVFAVVLLLLAALTGTMSLIINLEKVRRLRYLSLFALSIGIWMIAEMDIMQIVTGNYYIVASISYIMLPIALIGFLLLLKDVALERYSKILNGLSILWGVYLVISVLLQLLANIHLVDEIYFFYQVIILSAVTVIGLLIYESIRFHNKSAQKYVYSICIILVAVSIDIYKFVTGDFFDMSKTTSAGIAIFLLFLIIDTLNQVRRAILKEGQNMYLEKIAYSDVLTGGNNRAAFEKDVDELLNLNTKFRLINFDLNDLKVINDNHGHNSGDVLLIDFYKALEKAYGDTSKCYRVGGDEFMVIQFATGKNSYEVAQLNLEQHLKDMSSNLGYTVSSAHGEAIYEYKQKFSDFKHDVDKKMYEMKKMVKTTK